MQRRWSLQAARLREEGLFRATTATVILSRLGGIFSATPLQEDLFQETMAVEAIDIFVSHSWAADRRAKFLAMCFALNLSLAMKSTLTAILLGQCLLGLLPPQSVSMVFLVAMDVPVLAFFLVLLFGQQITCGLWGPGLWLDKICVNQNIQSDKKRAIAGLAAFVARSSQMLVHWDETYFQRLWCNFELSVFLKCHDVRKLQFVPLWLPPWLLTTMTCCYAGGRLAAIAAAFADIQALEDQSSSQQTGRGTALAFGTNRLLKYIADGQGFLVFCIPSLIFSIVSFHAKLHGHRLMLESIRNFDLREADCAIEEDRLQIEAQVCELFDGLEEPIVVSPIESSATFSDIEETSLPVLSVEERRAIRAVTDYGDDGECIGAFNSYVHGPLLNAVMEDLGDEVQAPWLVCSLSFLPATLCFAALTLTSAPYFRRAGFPSAALFVAENYVQILCMTLLILPLAHPLLLRAMSFFATIAGPGVLRDMLILAAGIAIYSLLLLVSSILTGALEVFVLTLHVAFLAGFLVAFLLVFVGSRSLFGGSHGLWQLPQISCRCLART
eukprot:s123_g24.t1